MQNLIALLSVLPPKLSGVSDQVVVITEESDFLYSVIAEINYMTQIKEKKTGICKAVVIATVDSYSRC